MKRHRNSLLLSKRAEFEGNYDAWRSASPGDPASIGGEHVEVPIKDGYDWLHQIKAAHSRRWGAMGR